jgi:hypothetical protein
MKHLINLGSQFIVFRDEADDLKGKNRFVFNDSLFRHTYFCLLIVFTLDYSVRCTSPSRRTR